MGRTNALLRHNRPSPKSAAPKAPILEPGFSQWLTAEHPQKTNPRETATFATQFTPYPNSKQATPVTAPEFKH